MSLPRVEANARLELNGDQQEFHAARSGEERTGTLSQRRKVRKATIGSDSVLIRRAAAPLRDLLMTHGYELRSGVDRGVLKSNLAEHAETRGKRRQERECASVARDTRLGSLRAVGEVGFGYSNASVTGGKICSKRTFPMTLLRSRTGASIAKTRCASKISSGVGISVSSAGRRFVSSAIARTRVPTCCARNRAIGEERPVTLSADEECFDGLSTNG